MDDPLEPVGALSALGDSTRRSAYDYVSAQGRPVGRDEVATALGIGVLFLLFVKRRIRYRRENSRSRSLSLLGTVSQQWLTGHRAEN